VVYIESLAFTRRLQQLGGAFAGDILAAIQSELLDDPLRGDLVPGLGGIRKARAADPGRRKGKRGGFRYLYLYLPLRGHIHLLFLLSKDEQADLSEPQRRALRDLVEVIKREAGK
jgi:hypothetical protein